MRERVHRVRKSVCSERRAKETKVHRRKRWGQGSGSLIPMSAYVLGFFWFSSSPKCPWYQWHNQTRLLHLIIQIAFTIHRNRTGIESLKFSIFIGTLKENYNTKLL